MKDKFAHWDVLFIQYLKRDWKILSAWIVGLGLFSGGFVPAFVEITKGQGLIGMYETMKNPAMIAMVGRTPIKEAADYTLGAMYSHMMLLFCSLFAMIASVLYVVSHTRKEEENGLTEFICTYSIGRYANSFALMIEQMMVHSILSVFIAVIMIWFDTKTIDTAPAFLFGGSIGLAGMMGAVIALLMAQIMASAGGAMGWSLGIVGLLYVIRGGTDAADSGLSVINPMGWTYMTYPFTKNNWILIIPCIIFCIVIMIISLILEKERDIGAGYIPESGKRSKVKKSLLSVHGLMLRLNRNTIIGWSVTLFLLGAAYGSIYGDMQTFLSGNELLEAMFTAEGISIEESFTMTIMVVLSGIAMILPIAVMNRLVAEEVSGRLGALYATKTGRGKMYWMTAIIASIMGALALLSASLGLGGTAVSVMEDSKMELIEFIQAGLNYFPVILFITALSGAILGVVPKYAKLLYIYGIQYFSELFLKYFKFSGVGGKNCNSKLDSKNAG